MRNKKRTININTMNSVDSVVTKKYNYQTFYFSRTLEHVVFNEPNPKAETKYYNIDKFINNLPIPIEEFLAEFLPPLANETYLLKYKESWVFIAQETNSLKRYTNVPLLFTYLNEKISKTYPKKIVN